MGKHHDWLAGRAVRQILVEPGQLIGPQIPHAARLEVVHIVERNKMHAILVEAVPAIRGIWGEAIVKGAAIIFQQIMFAGDVMCGEAGAANDLVGGIELISARQMGNIAGVEQQGRARFRAHRLHRGGECRGRIHVRGVGETDMAIADLHEAQAAGARGSRGTANQRAGGNTAGYGPDHTGTDPCHALQDVAAAAAPVCVHCGHSVGCGVLDWGGGEFIRRGGGFF